MQIVYFITSSLLLLGAIVGGQEEDPAVTRYREYIKINSAHPSPLYDGCIEWLRNQTNEIGLDFNLERFEGPEESLFALWMTWNGSNPQLKSILMDSHMDVVAVNPSQWTYPPFDAFKDQQGYIYGRGTIDMKSTTVATLEAVRRLKNSGFRPLRTLHISVLPDEEVYSGGVKGFVNSTSFAKLNIGFAVDEAGSGRADGLSDEMFITYAEKSVWQFNFTVRGKAAHASTMPSITAGQKLQVVINRLLEFRQSELDLLEDSNNNYTMENITSLNLVQIGGGMGNNIIPDELWVSFDMRIVTRPGMSLEDIDQFLNSVSEESGNDTSLTFLVKALDADQTPTDDTNIWWVVLQTTCLQLNTTCTPNIPSGVTDGRYIRNTGIPVFGLNPFPYTVPMAHQTDERMNQANFLAGIDRLEVFVRNFLSLSGSLHP